VTSYQLKHEAGRGWVYEAAGFVARIAEDGTVAFNDRHIGLGLALPLPLPLPEGTPTLEGSLRRVVNPRERPRRSRESPTEMPGPIPRMSPYRADPRDWCRYPNPCAFVASIMAVNVAGTFDMTDEILRLGHQDPYGSAKASFLASTAAFRQELASRAVARARAHALEELRRRLEVIERDNARSPNGRRAALEALLQELDPNPDVGGPARSLIEAHLHPLMPDAGGR
jgi:hypothetical protein